MYDAPRTGPMMAIADNDYDVKKDDSRHKRNNKPQNNVAMIEQRVVGREKCRDK
jgi:hypothetical protein